MTAESEAGPVHGASSSVAAADAGLFVRRSSGLVRDIGLLGALGVNAGAQSIGGALAFFGLVLMLFPGVNVLLMLVIGGALIAPLAWVYSQLAVTMPRSGGEYVYFARVLHPIAGTWAGTLHLFVWWSGLAALGAFWAKVFLPYVLVTLASVVHAPFLNTLANDVATQDGTFVATTIVLGIAGLAAVAGAKTAASVASGAVIAGVVSVALIIAELFLHSPSAIRHALDGAAGASGVYGQVIAAARAHGWHPGYTLSGTVAALPYAFLIFAGYWYTAFVAGEIKRPARTHLLATLVTLGGSVVLVALVWIGLQGHLGGHFSQAASFLQSHAPATYARLAPVGVSPQSVAALVSDPVTKVVIAIGFLGWLVCIPIVWLTGMSRVLFALSFDRLLPEWVAGVSRRRHSPLAAVLVNLVISELFLALIVYSQGFAQAFRNANLIALALSTVACVAVIVLPLRRRDLYDASPKVVKGSWLGVPVITLIAVVGGLFCATGTYLALTEGRYSGGYTTVSVISLVAMVCLGPLLYLASRYVRRKEGIDISLAMRSLPPE